MTEKNQTYVDMHKAAMVGDGSTSCTLEGGLSVMRVIEAAEKAAKSTCWVFNDN
jgi:hypothetical protein